MCCHKKAGFLRAGKQRRRYSKKIAVLPSVSVRRISLEQGFDARDNDGDRKSWAEILNLTLEYATLGDTAAPYA
jgi:hypothetical protein